MRINLFRENFHKAMRRQKPPEDSPMEKRKFLFTIVNSLAWEPQTGTTWPEQRLMQSFSFLKSRQSDELVINATYFMTR